MVHGLFNQFASSCLNLICLKMILCSRTTLPRDASTACRAAVGATSRRSRRSQASARRLYLGAGSIFYCDDTQRCLLLHFVLLLLLCCVCAHT